MSFSALPTQPALRDSVARYLDLIGPAWREQSVVLPPSDVPVDELQLLDLLLDEIQLDDRVLHLERPGAQNRTQG